MKKCKTCGKYYFDDQFDRPKHACPPEWKAWLLESGYDREDTEDTFMADNAEEAAEFFLEKWDNSNAELTEGSVKVAVEKLGSNEVRVCRVTTETIAKYTATEME